MAKPQGILLHGVPGTGKTMFANALANHLHKKLLVVNVGTFGRIDSEAFRFLFREAKLQDAIVFFDECEPLFESRDLKSGSSVNVALSEIEKFTGTIVMATNRPQDIDNAMHRRITLAVSDDEFVRATVSLAHEISLQPSNTIDRHDTLEHRYNSILRHIFFEKKSGTLTYHTVSNLQVM